MVLPETFTHFTRTAAEQLRWKAARPLVEDELLTHLCDQRDALMAGGMDEAAAAAESLRLTGDPYEIGTALDRVHRPKTPKLLFALAALIALAGLAFTALVSFRDYELSYFAVHQSVALLLGTAALLAAYFLDFTLLGRFALPLALVFRWVLALPLHLCFDTYPPARSAAVAPADVRCAALRAARAARPGHFRCPYRPCNSASVLLTDPKPY